jgi:cellulose synthase operon protein C
MTLIPRLPVLFGSIQGSAAGLPKGSASHARRVLLLLLAALLLGACGQVSLTEEQHFQRALEAEASGELRAAMIEWKNVLQKNPSNADARVRLGLLNLELGDLPAARAELQRAVDLGTEPAVVGPPLARVWLMEGNYQRVLDELDPSDFAAEPAADRAQVLLLRGEAFAAQNRPDAAMGAFEEALALAPDLALAHVGIAAVHAAQGRPDEARAQLQTALAMAPRLHQGWNLLGDLQRSEGQLEAAEAAYGEAIQHGPSPYFFHLKRALTRMALQDMPGMQQDLQAMRRLGPREPSTAYVQGLVHYQQGRYAEAQTAFEDALSRAPDFQPAIFFLGASQFAQQRWRQAEHNLERFLRAHPESDDAARLLALVRVQEGDLARAEGLLRPVLGRNPDDVLALNLMGNLYLARGEHDEGIGHLRRLTAIQPENPATRATLAAGLLRAGERDEGLRELEAAIEQAPGQHGLEVAYIVQLLQGQEYDAALEAIARLQEALPDNPLPYNLRAAAFMGQGDLGRAREALMEALQMAPGDPAVSSNLAQMALQDGDREEARRLYRESLQEHPGHVGVSLRLAQLEAEDGNVLAMRRVLEQSIERYPEVLAPRLVLGRYHLSQNEPRRALALLEPARQSAADDVQMLDLHARAQIAAGQNVQAVTTLRALAQRVPESAEARFRLGAGFEQADSLSEARTQYRRALELEPTHAQALQSLAALELREGRPDETLALARRMQQQETVAAAGHALEGRVHTAAGRHEQAARAVEQAYALGPSAEYAVALGLAQQQLGQPEAAAELLGTRLAEYPDETAVRFHLAQALMATGDNAGAIREYEDLVQTLPENVVVLNNLAFLYQAEGDERALEYAERAYARAPDNPAVADTLGWVLVNSGEVERALPLLQIARQMLPDRPEVRYHYATALARSGHRAEARQELAALLNEVETFPQREEAEALLRGLQ